MDKNSGLARRGRKTYLLHAVVCTHKGSQPAAAPKKKSHDKPPFVFSSFFPRRVFVHCCVGADIFSSLFLYASLSYLV